MRRRRQLSGAVLCQDFAGEFAARSVANLFMPSAVAAAERAQG
jgi:hypothetical protein